MEKIFADGILKDKVAFVTGGGTGITGGVARALAEAGARIAITSRKEENLIPQKQFIEENGSECFAVAADVRDYAAGLGDNEKAALGLAGTAEAGMKEMSKKFTEMGGEVYLDAEKVKESNRAL